MRRVFREMSSTTSQRPGLRGPTGIAVLVASAALRPAVDAARLGGRAVERAGSSIIARAMGRALSGPLVESVARDLVRYAVVERMVETALVGDAIDRAVARVLDGPELERAVDAALASPAMERLVGTVIESRLVDEAVARLLESDDLWLLVDEVARSPAVTAAITQQSLGFADQVAGGVRARSRNADAWLERAARRALRRPPAGPDGT
jgi:hypothetical protein